ncbi:hypothetical protein SISNIDRAFT_449183 [Sistotremastrum niveocremeum HHB9708]|uniref:Uncharacterized protein n=1 Tax=Sistotremastrum niveocremeum HHB9708 TaxID=1314777 RepID=A0A164ZDK4_9AGAM|nr:hypothetical protein SISNIDRAFT_449183 [Sistotremastrum niveocremeum HHB9708]
MDTARSLLSRITEKSNQNEHLPLTNAQNPDVIDFPVPAQKHSSRKIWIFWIVLCLTIPPLVLYLSLPFIRSDTFRDFTSPFQSKPSATVNDTHPPDIDDYIPPHVTVPINQTRPSVSKDCQDLTNLTVYCIREREHAAPQHDLDLPYPEGRTGRYITFNNHFRYTGLHVPLSAYIGGPSVGEPILDTTIHGPAARSVDQQYWHQVCPPDEVVYLNVTTEQAEMGIEGDGKTEGSVLVEKWVERLSRKEERCVEIMFKTPRIFDFTLLDNPHLISIWPDFHKSPFVRDFIWSPLVHRAYSHNVHFMASLPDSWKVPELGENYTLEGLLVIAVRRGDYKGHCYLLWDAGLPFNTWDMLPELPDAYIRDAPDSPAEKAKFVKHCWPSEEEMMAKIRKAREDSGNTLKRIFMASNAELEYLEEFRENLLKDGWESVVHTLSKGIEFPTEEEALCDAMVDMEIARRAQVFIGNGFSSLTSNAVMMRLTDGKDPRTIRFW